MQPIIIAGRQIGPSYPPFIIAEMSGNHNHSLQRALEIVQAAAGAGAHAVKLQTYTADSMTLDVDEGEFRIDDPASLWHGKSLYHLYHEAYTPWEWHQPIFDLCKELGLVAFSTPFDASAVDFLESLNVPCYKIASFENTDLPLIKKVAATGKPLIISTGMATLTELDELVQTVQDAGGKDLILLKCTSTYPASPEESHLRTLPHLQAMFDCQVGLSDHTLGIGVAIAAVAMGATVIEKHFTLRRADGGVDSAFSLEPEELRTLVQETQQARLALGEIHYGPTKREIASLAHRRSLYFVKNLHAGDIITEDAIRSIRPGLGLPTKFADWIVGRRVTVDVKRGTPVKWDLL